MGIFIQRASAGTMVRESNCAVGATLSASAAGSKESVWAYQGLGPTVSG